MTGAGRHHASENGHQRRKSNARADRGRPASFPDPQAIFRPGRETIAFTINFAFWTMFSVIGIRIKSELRLSETEFGLLVATPILTGSLIRLPLGILTDRFGGRSVFFLHMILVAIPTYGLAFATQYWQYLDHRSVRRSGRRFVCCRNRLHLRLVPEREQGTAMGIFGAGNAGNCGHQPRSTIDHRHFGWRAVPQMFPSPCWRRRCCSGYSPIPIRT